MNIVTRFSLSLFAATLSLNSLPVFADSGQTCHLAGSYGYLYSGNSYTATGPLPLAETGVLTVDSIGNVSGEATLAFQFSNFGGKGPLWLLLREVQSNGVITPDMNNPCKGSLDFLATATVIKTSNSSILPEGVVLFANTPRSIAYTISGLNNEVVDLIGSFPGTIASGTAHKQNN